MPVIAYERGRGRGRLLTVVLQLVLNAGDLPADLNQLVERHALVAHAVENLAVGCYTVDGLSI
eukprot:1195651-Prorocentrum_minimum.AAC.2